MARHKKSGNSGETTEHIAHIIASAANVVPRLAQTFDTIGSIIGFRRWSRSLGKHPIFSTRRELWLQSVIPNLVTSGEDLSVFEFGVAYGEASKWWLTTLPHKSLKYGGFDRFTGLPTAWRNLPKGAFNANGNTPDIDDDRVTWYVGDLEETILQIRWDQHEGQKFFIFDLDIFAPSLVAWDSIQPKLCVGDVLYFDEAYDIDERLLLKNYLLPTEKFEVLGSSPFGIVLKYI